MAKAYWIGRVDVNNEEGYKPYAAANPAIFKKFGAKFVVRGGKHPPGLEPPDDSDELEDDDEERDPEHDFGEPCRRARPAAEQPSPQPHRGEPERGENDEQLDRPHEVGAEAHERALAPSRPQVAGSSSPSRANIRAGSDLTIGVAARSAPTHSDSGGFCSSRRSLGVTTTKS